jgi:hypothetical protein
MLCDYNYKNGDSIIKKADSNELTIKKGDSIVIWHIPCPKWKLKVVP